MQHALHHFAACATSADKAAADTFELEGLFDTMMIITQVRDDTLIRTIPRRTMLLAFVPLILSYDTMQTRHRLSRPRATHDPPPCNCDERLRALEALQPQRMSMNEFLYKQLGVLIAAGLIVGMLLVQYINRSVQ